MKSKIFLPSSLMIFIFIASYSGNTSGQKNKKKASNSSLNMEKHVPQQIIADASPGCDSSLWEHIYDPVRLQVLERCKIVYGIIEESNADPDGDQHMLLKLDHGQKDLLTKKNKTKKNGNLVIEVVCVNKITRKRAIGACKGYKNQVSLPGLGDHVKVTGSYVIDSHNGWAEIHPVSKIEKIK